MNTALDSLLSHPQIWRGDRPTWIDKEVVGTGFAELDAQLSESGWPRGTLIEVLLPRPGMGELQLLLPALRQLNHEKKWIVLIEPPYIPYAPAWQSSGLDLSRLLWVRPRTSTDHLWAVEQALHSGTCGAVLSWPRDIPTFQQLRRLQLAAEAGQCWGWLFRPLISLKEPTPAALRLRLEAHDDRLAVNVVKQRGGWAGETTQIPLPFSGR